jgi:hypothetical protein
LQNLMPRKIRVQNFWDATNFRVQKSAFFGASSSAFEKYNNKHSENSIFQEKQSQKSNNIGVLFYFWIIEFFRVQKVFVFLDYKNLHFLAEFAAWEFFVCRISAERFL